MVCIKGLYAYRVAIERHELDLVGLAFAVDMYDDTHVAGLQIELGQVARQYNLTVFLKHHGLLGHG